MLHRVASLVYLPGDLFFAHLLSSLYIAPYYCFLYVHIISASTVYAQPMYVSMNNYRGVLDAPVTLPSLPPTTMSSLISLLFTTQGLSRTAQLSRTSTPLRDLELR